jgi:hypothetical protein
MKDQGSKVPIHTPRAILKFSFGRPDSSRFGQRYHEKVMLLSFATFLRFATALYHATETDVCHRFTNCPSVWSRVNPEQSRL